MKILFEKLFSLLVFVSFFIISYSHPSYSPKKAQCDLSIKKTINEIKKFKIEEASYKKDSLQDSSRYSGNQNANNKSVYIYFSGDASFSLIDSPKLLGVYAREILENCNDINYVEFDLQLSNKQLQNACGFAVQVDCMVEYMSEVSRSIIYLLDAEDTLWINQCRNVRYQSSDGFSRVKYDCDWSMSSISNKQLALGVKNEVEQFYRERELKRNLSMIDLSTRGFNTSANNLEIWITD